MEQINTNPETPDTIEELTAEVLTPEEAQESRKRYASKLIVLTEIHGEIAPELNAERDKFFTIYHSREDAFIPEPEGGMSLLDLMLDTERADNPALVTVAPMDYSDCPATVDKSGIEKGWNRLIRTLARMK